VFIIKKANVSKAGNKHLFYSHGL